MGLFSFRCIFIHQPKYSRMIIGEIWTIFAVYMTVQNQRTLMAHRRVYIIIIGYWNIQFKSNNKGKRGRPIKFYIYVYNLLLQLILMEASPRRNRWGHKKEEHHSHQFTHIMGCLLLKLLVYRGLCTDMHLHYCTYASTIQICEFM